VLPDRELLNCCQSQVFFSIATHFLFGHVSTLLSADFSSAISTSTLLPDHENQASGDFTHRECIRFDRELPDKAISPQASHSKLSTLGPTLSPLINTCQWPLTSSP
jgi:hypothetical protein